MLPLRYSQRWRIAGILVLLGVFGAAVAPTLGFWPGSSIHSLIEIDKWLHGLTFLFLTVWFSGQYARRSYWRVVVGLVVFGLVIEFVQRYLAYRSSDAADVVANVAGISAGLLIALAGLGGWSQRVENWMAARNTGT